MPQTGPPDARRIAEEPEAGSTPAPPEETPILSPRLVRSWATTAHKTIIFRESYTQRRIPEPRTQRATDHRTLTPPTFASLQARRAVNVMAGCRSVDEYERIGRIDEGTYGIVFRGRDKRDGRVVALKKVKMERERDGFPLTALREVNILLAFHHPNIVNVLEVVVGPQDSVYMVMEYMDHDLKARCGRRE